MKMITGSKISTFPERGRDFPRPFQMPSNFGEEGRGLADLPLRRRGKALTVMRNFLKDLELAGCEAVQIFPERQDVTATLHELQGAETHCAGVPWSQEQTPR